MVIELDKKGVFNMPGKSIGFKCMCPHFMQMVHLSLTLLKYNITTFTVSEICESQINAQSLLHPGFPGCLFFRANYT